MLTGKSFLHGIYVGLISFLQARFTNLNVFVHSNLLRERSSIIYILYMVSRRSKVAIPEVLKET